MHSRSTDQNRPNGRSALALIEARERTTDLCCLPGDDVRPDCWPDASAECEPIDTSEENSPLNVALEVAFLVAVPLAMVGVLILALSPR
jgi:hypothetical protein